MIQRPDRLTFVECKSAGALSSGRLSGARRVAGHLDAFPVEVAAVYGGDEERRRADGWILPSRRMDRLSQAAGTGRSASPR